MARKCRFTERSASSRPAVSTSSVSKSFSHAGLVCCKRNSKRSNENWKRKDCSIQRGKKCCRNFRNASALSLPQAVLRSAIFSTSCGVPAAVELDRRVNELAACLHRCWRNFIVREQTRLRLFSERTVGRELLTRIQEGKQTVDWRRESLQRNAAGFLGSWRGRLAENAAALRRHDPSREIVLRRSRLSELARRLITCPPQL